METSRAGARPVRRPASLGKTNAAGSRTDEQRQRMSAARRAGTESRNPVLSYTAIHKRLRKDRGTPRVCDHCGTTTAKKFEWAYTGEGHERGAYSADLSQYIRLCTSCHMKFDSNPGGVRVRWLTGAGR